jgi:pyruvate dehydrogenase E1 component
LRRYFEVDAAHLVVAVLHGLVAEGRAKADAVAIAIDRYGIDPDTTDPWSA